MLHLVWKKPAPYVPPDLPRLWVVFFRDSGGKQSWWDAFTRPGFRHVSAAAWYEMSERWVFFDPTHRATTIQVLEAGPAADAVFGTWARQAGAILRVRSAAERTTMPGFLGCVGQVKSLLGIRSGALVPATLHRHLLARGAEVIELPRSEIADEPVQGARSPAGRPADQSLARA